MIAQVALPAEVVEEIRAHASATYPEECCGVLIGIDDGRERTVRRCRRLENQVPSERERRFVIPPEELRRLERELDPTPDRVLGFYHSHPDHPARPSEFDRDHAWPWYTYVVVNVTGQGTNGLAAFELDPDSLEFAEVPWTMAAPGPASPSYARVSESS